jgi:hypothetical protein
MMLYMDITSDQMKRLRRWCITGWHSNQKTSSPEEFTPQWNTAGDVKKMVGTTLKTVILWYLFLQYIT